MLETSLNYMEREVLLLLRQLDAETGAVTRERLTLLGRGRGLEVARSLLVLKSLGLIETFEKRPSFWRRLFGAKTQELLRAVPRTAPLPEAPPALSTEEFADAAPMIEAEPLAVEQPVEVAPAAFTAQPEPAPAPVIETPVEPAPVAEAPPAPVVPPAPEVQATEPRVPFRPRPVPQGYTDELGGAPIAVTPSSNLDPALVEGMRDFLDGIGLEMTFAGEALAAHRLRMGLSVGESVMQLVLFAIAHAAHHEILNPEEREPEELKEYAHALLEELERLTEAGEIRRDRYYADKQMILTLADRRADRQPLLDQLLSDPVGGAAPPALLPEELRGVSEDDDDDDLF